MLERHRLTGLLQLDRITRTQALARRTEAAAAAVRCLEAEREVTDASAALEAGYEAWRGALSTRMAPESLLGCSHLIASREYDREHALRREITARDTSLKAQQISALARMRAEAVRERCRLLARRVRRNREERALIALELLYAHRRPRS